MIFLIKAVYAFIQIIDFKRRQRSQTIILQSN